VDVVRMLRDRGHTAYFAGGCVRDELLGSAPEDYDVATDARPEEVRGAFPRLSEVGAAFGVMLVRRRSRTIEVATFRTEGAYSDKRRPDEVTYADAPSDAARRDFTINALFLDPLERESEVLVGAASRRVRGRVIDYVEGVADLGAGVVRAVGDPDERLAEDHLRALRAVRFTARLGFELDTATAEAVRRHATELEGVSPERVGDEVRRMLRHANRARAVELLDQLGLSGPALRDGLGPARNAPGGGLLGRLEAGAGLAPALAALAVDRLGGGLAPDAANAEKVVRSWRRSLCLSNQERDDLAATLEGVRTIVGGFGSGAVAQRKRWAVSAWFPDALAVVRAGDPAAAAAVDESVAALGASPGGLAPAPLVDGGDLRSVGFRPGPRVGEALRALYDLQLEGTVRTRGEALEAARKLLSGAPERPN